MTRVGTKVEIGIDEAGRGPLAGPVAVGVALVPTNFDWKQLLLVNDSKQVSEKNRETVFKQAKQLKKFGLLDFQVTLVSAKIIDKIGIVPAIKKAIKKSLSALLKRNQLTPGRVMVKLDGGLKAPAEFKQQETIIKGDAKEKVIGLASIMAKVTRDQYMERLALRPEFEAYGFSIHKGYGTKKHREQIAKRGLSSVHRASFCRNIQLK